MGMLFVFIPRVSLRLPWAMCLLGLQPTLPKSETLVNYFRFIIVGLLVSLYLLSTTQALLYITFPIVAVP